MGLFSFAKNVGKKLFKGEPDDKDIKSELDALGLDTKGVDISVDGDKVKIGGNAADQATKEKIILAAGNVEGIASVEDNAGLASGEARDVIFHEVQKGENLWKIAEKHLGNGADYTKIFEANKPMLKDPDLIYPGQVLRIEK